MKGLRNLCTPAYVYLVISVIALIIMIFIIKAIYILFWTWILNLMCSANATGVAWFLLLLPLIIMFILIGAMLISGKSPV